MPQVLFYKPGKAPDAQEKEPKEIALFLERELNSISQGFTEHYYVKYRELHEEPLRPRDGMVVYADGSNWDPGDGEGIYAYVAGSWVAAGVAATVAAAKPAFSAHKGGVAQTGVVSGASTQVTFGTEVYDIGGYFASSGWTPPAGLVTMSASAIMDGTYVDTADSGMYVYKNGAAYKIAYGAIMGTTYAVTQISIEDRANGSDVYTIRVYANMAAGTGSIRSTTDETWFMGHWIGP